MKGEQMMLCKLVAVQGNSFEAAGSNPYKGVLTEIGKLIRDLAPLVVILIVATIATTSNYKPIGVSVEVGVVTALSLVGFLGLGARQAANERLASLAKQALEKVTSVEKKNTIKSCAGDPDHDFRRESLLDAVGVFSAFTPEGSTTQHDVDIFTQLESISTPLSAKIQGSGNKKSALAAAKTIVLSLLANLQTMRVTGNGVPYQNVTAADLEILRAAVAPLAGNYNA